MNRLLLLVAIILGLFLIVSCGGDDEEDEGESSGGNECSDMADLVVPTIHVYIQQCPGCPMGFDNIRICNNGGADSTSYKFEVTLSTSPEMAGEHYSAHKSGYYEGLAAGSCIDIIAAMPVPNVPPGDYFIYVLADADFEAIECNDSNNWARTDKWFHIE